MAHNIVLAERFHRPFSKIRADWHLSAERHVRPTLQKGDDRIVAVGIRTPGYCAPTHGIVRLTAPRSSTKYGKKEMGLVFSMNARPVQSARSLGGPPIRMCREHIRKNHPTKQRLPVMRVPIQMDLHCEDQGRQGHDFPLMRRQSPPTGVLQGFLRFHRPSYLAAPRFDSTRIRLRPSLPKHPEPVNRSKVR